MKILLTVKSLLVSYGGPAFSVTALASALTEAGADVGLWAPDRSAGVTPLLPAGSPVRRLIGTPDQALKSFGAPDVLHDNGIWMPHNRRLALLAASRGIPRVVSTRGMLNPWALDNKRLKKRFAWMLYQRRNLRQAQCHHTTAEAETGFVQALGLHVPVVTIPNGVDIPAEVSSTAARELRTQNRNPAKVALFLGRIYPVKGLPMLVEAWSRVRPDGWSLRIAGPDEAGHRKNLERGIAAAGLSNIISFGGPVAPAARQSTFSGADLFILPSHSESFGMVVAEALAHGLPVLTTTGAPWPSLPRAGCGWWVPPTMEGIAEGLREATTQSSEALRSMGLKGRALVTSEFAWPQIAHRMLAMYDEVRRN